ncbi:hypothetical protein MED193_22316 [Roseobacter sp. MED193]|nr:hypothetical protein MED193_22316 [Roseobacter sp. MED193]
MLCSLPIAGESQRFWIKANLTRNRGSIETNLVQFNEIEIYLRLSQRQAKA